MFPTLHAACCKIGKKAFWPMGYAEIFSCCSYAAVMLQCAAGPARDLVYNGREAGDGPPAAALCRYGPDNIKQHCSMLLRIVGSSIECIQNRDKCQHFRHIRKAARAPSSRTSVMRSNPLRHPQGSQVIAITMFARVRVRVRWRSMTCQ